MLEKPPCFATRTAFFLVGSALLGGCSAGTEEPTAAGGGRESSGGASGGAKPVTGGAFAAGGAWPSGGSGPAASGSSAGGLGASGTTPGGASGSDPTRGGSTSAGEAGRSGGELAGAGSGGNAGQSRGGATSVGGVSTGGTSGRNGTGGGSTGGSTAGGSTTTGGNCQGNNTVNLGLVGYATLNGGTTGGKGGTRTVVSTGAELVAALEAKQDSATPLTIVVQGTITPANSGGVEKIDVKEVRDVSIIGAGAGAEFDGIGLKIVKSGNIVVRNLRIHHVDIGDKDAISIEGPADHIWIDHCELYSTYEGVDKDHYDGLLDAKAETEYLTYSWNYFHDSWKTSLVGSSESDAYDRKLTLHHNYFQNCNSRLPLFRGGSAHVFNNYYRDIAETAINSRLGACIQIENNYFSNVRNPWVSAFSDMLGGGEIICNTLADGSAFAYSEDDEIYELPACTLNVPYEFSAFLNRTADVPAIVMANAGVGKLADPEMF